MVSHYRGKQSSQSQSWETLISQIEKVFRCILHEFQDLYPGTEKRKKERRKSRYFSGFLLLAIWQKYKRNMTGKYLLCIERWAQLREVILFERFWQTIRHQHVFAFPLWSLYAIKRHWIIITSSVEHKEPSRPEGEGLSWWQRGIITRFHRFVSLRHPSEFIWVWRRIEHLHVLRGG